MPVDKLKFSLSKSNFNPDVSLLLLAGLISVSGIFASNILNKYRYLFSKEISNHF